MRHTVVSAVDAGGWYIDCECGATFVSPSLERAISEYGQHIARIAALPEVERGA